MTPTTPRARRARLVGLSCCALAALPGCERSAPTTATTQATPGQPAAQADPAHTYEGILGIVEQIPLPGQPATSFRIHHEHIPTFRSPTTGDIHTNPNGAPGMRAMVMEMPPAEGLDISSYAVGDKVRFTMAVWTQPRVSWRVTAIEKLPPDTPIDFADKP